MDFKKLVLAGIGAFLALFITGAVWHLALFKGVFDELGIFARKEPLVYMGFLGLLSRAFLMAYLYPLGYQGGNPAKEGVRFGLLIGLLVGSVWVLETPAVQPVSSLLTWLFLEGSFVLIQSAVAGFLIGVIYGNLSPLTRGS